MAVEERGDAELVALARAGNKQAFDHLVGRYYAAAKRVARRMVADEEIAQDLVQEAFLQAYLSLSHLRDDDRFASWFYGIVLNVCRSFVRGPKREVLSLEAETGGRRLDVAPFSGPARDPQALAEEAELHGRVLAAVNALPPRDRAATLLFYYEQWSVREVAAFSGVSVAAVKVRLQRAREQLRERLLPLYPEMDRVTPTRRGESMMVKATIDGVYEHEKGSFVTLVDEAVQRMLHVWIGSGEALNIYLALHNPSTPRPLTFDLMAHLLQVAGLRLEQVCIAAFRENIYYATLKVRRGKKVHELDARPSDALALALRTGTPIYIAEELLENDGEDAEWIRHRRKPDYDESAGYRFGAVTEVLSRCTKRARNVLLRAQEDARGRGSDKRDTEHLLLGLLREAHGRSGLVLRKLGADLESARAAARALPR